MKKLATVISILGLLVGLGGGAAYALVFTPLALMNGWVLNPAGGTPAVGLENGIVHLKGVISGGTIGVTAFMLPNAFRPGEARFVPVECNGVSKGRLNIATNGVTVVIITSGVPGDCMSFTLLDGASFAK